MFLYRDGRFQIVTLNFWMLLRDNVTVTGSLRCRPFPLYSSHFVFVVFLMFIFPSVFLFFIFLSVFVFFLSLHLRLLVLPRVNRVLLFYCVVLFVLLFLLSYSIILLLHLLLIRSIRLLPHHHRHHLFILLLLIYLFPPPPVLPHLRLHFHDLFSSSLLYSPRTNILKSPFFFLRISSHSLSESRTLVN